MHPSIVLAAIMTHGSHPEGSIYVTAGGGDLAKQLISVYLTLFQLIMSGKVGHAAAAHRAAEERAEAARLARCASILPLGFSVCHQITDPSKS